MGLGDENFVVAPDVGLRCPICHEVFDDPVFCAGKPCQCVFCRDCFIALLREEDPKCPLDRLPIGAADFVPHLFVRNSVEALQVFCLNRDQGCFWTGRLDARRGHQDACITRVVDALKTVVAASDAESHALGSNVKELESLVKHRDARISDLENEVALRDEQLLALQNEIDESLIASKMPPENCSASSTLLHGATCDATIPVSLVLPAAARGDASPSDLQSEFAELGLSPSDQLWLIERLRGQDIEEERLNPGAIYCLIAKCWFDSWLRWAKCSGPGRDGLERPGPINNSSLLEAHVDETLRLGLCELKDVVFLSLPIWNLLHSWYGGGPSIKRRAVQRSCGIVEVELRGVRLHIFRSSKVDEPVNIVEPATTSVRELKKRVCEEQCLEPSCVRVWDYFNRTKYKCLDDSETATIESCRLFEGNPILFEEQNADGSWPILPEAPLRRSAMLTDLARREPAAVPRTAPHSHERSSIPSTGMMQVAISGSCCM